MPKVGLLRTSGSKAVLWPVVGRRGRVVGRRGPVIGRRSPVGRPVGACQRQPPKGFSDFSRFVPK